MDHDPARDRRKRALVAYFHTLPAPDQALVDQANPLISQSTMADFHEAWNLYKKSFIDGLSKSYSRFMEGKQEERIGNEAPAGWIPVSRLRYTQLRQTIICNNATYLYSNPLDSFLYHTRENRGSNSRYRRIICIRSLCDRSYDRYFLIHNQEPMQEAINLPTNAFPLRRGFYDALHSHHSITLDSHAEVLASNHSDPLVRLVGRILTNNHSLP
jgi:hypothetical protein